MDVVITVFEEFLNSLDFRWDAQRGRMVPKRPEHYRYDERRRRYVPIRKEESYGQSHPAGPQRLVDLANDARRGSVTAPVGLIHIQNNKIGWPNADSG
jgi:hypothetical protein